MTPEKTTMVSISLDEYKQLILKDAFLGAMMQASYSQASISFDSNELVLNADALGGLLKTMDAERYWGIYRAIKDKMEKEIAPEVSKN